MSPFVVALAATLAWVWLARTGLWQETDGDWRPRREWFARLLRIGNPAALQQVLRGLGSTGYTRALAHTADGTAAVAAPAEILPPLATRPAGAE